MAVGEEDKEDNYLSALDKFIFGVPEGFFDRFEEFDENTTPLSVHLDAFRQNLNSALTVGSIPFQMANTSELDLRFDQIHASERIRSLKSEYLDSEGNVRADRRLEEIAIARRRFQEEWGGSETKAYFARRTLQRLRSHIADTAFHASSEELLRQVLVMSWGAFETIANDVVRTTLNVNPRAVSKLLLIRPYKGFLNAKSILDALLRSDFNLSRSFGDFLSGLVPLDSLQKIKSASAALFDSRELEVALKDRKIGKIAQQRHLIVHRRSIVDLRYRQRTGDGAEVGAKLTLSSDHIENCLAAVRDVGCLFYLAAVKALPSDARAHEAG